MHQGQQSVQANIQATNPTMAQYPGTPGPSGLFGPQSTNMVQYGPLMCPPYGPQSPSGPQDPPGPRGL